MNDKKHRHLDWKSKKFNQGICTRCGINPLVKGLKKCQECRDKHQKLNKKIRSERIEARLCSLCGKHPPLDGFKRCQNCFDYNRIRDKSLREKGLCSNCRRSCLENKSHCENCLEKQRKKYIEEKISSTKNGICTVCNKNKPRQDFIVCDRCNEIERKRGSKRREKYKELWLCGKCGVPAMPNANVNLCEHCYFLRNARNASRISKNKGYATGAEIEILASHLKELWNKNNCICSLSGEKLTLGMNSSVDHIIPKTKGGTGNIENLRWVHEDVNQMKHDMSDEELMNWLDKIKTYQNKLKN